MYNCEKFDWETREDANTIRRYQEIIANPKRLALAKSCIKDTKDNLDKALKNSPAPSVSRNPATIKKLFK